MTGRLQALILSALALSAPALLRGEEVIVPAGTIIHCTMDEPNLSSKTAQPGDPVLCDAGPVYVFGEPVLPRGAYLEGRFADFRNPGHFWGKGWMQINFDRILLPGAELPLTTRVTSIPHMKVDTEGKIHGKGHAVRDSIEWMIPILWPVKVITLPMRGPRPALKGETRISLKLMEDLAIPQGVAGYAADRQQLRPGAFREGPHSPDPAATVADGYGYGMAVRPPLTRTPLSTVSDKGTVLILRDGTGLLVRDYWFEDGQKIQYHAIDGSSGLIPIQALDLHKTVVLNRERGVQFMINSSQGGN